MANAIKWSSAASIASALGSSLSGLSNNVSILSSAIDNRSNRHMFSDWMLTVTYNTSPATNGRCTLYLVPSVDGTNYADCVAGSEPVNLFAGVFPLRAVSTAQVLTARRVLLPPALFKVALKNESGSAMATGSGTNTLQYIFYDEEVQ